MEKLKNLAKIYYRQQKLSECKIAHKYFDLNNNGFMDFEEFKLYSMAELPHSSSALSLEIFTKSDTNFDGKLSYSELIEGIFPPIGSPAHFVLIESIFRDRDLNNDGKLSKREYYRFIFLI